MENRHEHLLPEENQGWGAYATPPPVPGQQNKVPPGSPGVNNAAVPPAFSSVPAASTTPSEMQMSLCLRVRAMLPALLENDGEIRPDMARAIYGHLAVCPDCVREFEAMKRVVSLVENLGQAEMPMDFSQVIMQRILTTQPDKSAARPFSPVPSAHSGSVSASVETVPRNRELNTTVSPTQQTTVQATSTTQTRNEQELLTNLGVSLRERLTLASLLSAVVALCLATGWGRQMLGANLAAARDWLEQIGEMLCRVPLLGGLFYFAFKALTQVSDLIGSAYRSMGAVAAQGFALDVALMAGTYYYLIARRQRGQRLGT